MAVKPLSEIKQQLKHNHVFLITGVKAPSAKEEKIFKKQTEQGK